jgi:hypothetical protein
MEVNEVADMRNQGKNYLSYLLRVWRTGGEEDGVWLASLTNPFTGESLGFTSLTELLAFLQSQIDDRERLAPEENRSGPGA